MLIGGLVFSLVDRVEAKDQLTSGTASKQARQQAIGAVPYEQLNPSMRSKLKDILDKPSIYRRLPITEIDIDPDYFVFLVRHPEVIVNIWQIMGITKMKSERVGPYELKTSDGEGTLSNIELVYGSNNLHVFYATGSYEGPILKKQVRGRCVLILRTDYNQGPEGAPRAKSSLDVFLKVDNTTASLIAKTLNPIVGSTADHNFVESLNFLQRLNETTEKNGGGVQRMAGRLQNITPQVRRDFIEKAGVVYQRRSNPVTATVNPLLYPASQVQGYGQTIPEAGYPVRPSGLKSNDRSGVQPIPSTQRTTLNPDTAQYPKTMQIRRPGVYPVNPAGPQPYYQAPYDRAVQPASYWATPRGQMPQIIYPGRRFGR